MGGLISGLLGAVNGHAQDIYLRRDFISPLHHVGAQHLHQQHPFTAVLHREGETFVHAVVHFNLMPIGKQRQAFVQNGGFGEGNFNVDERNVFVAVKGFEIQTVGQQVQHAGWQCKPAGRVGWTVGNDGFIDQLNRNGLLDDLTNVPGFVQRKSQAQTKNGQGISMAQGESKDQRCQEKKGHPQIKTHFPWAPRDQQGAVVQGVGQNQRRNAAGFLALNVRQLRAAVLAKNVFTGVDEVAAGADHGCLSMRFISMIRFGFAVRRDFVQGLCTAVRNNFVVG